MTEPKKKGFAAMDPERQREIAKRGGISAHAQGVAHTFTREEAAKAGSKGGMATQERRRAAKSGK